MKKLLIGLTLLSSMSAYASGNDCKKLYLSFDSDSERRAALELQAQFKDSLNVKLLNSIEVPLYNTTENEATPALEGSATIIVLSEETDMTGSEIKIEAYKTNEQGKIRFSGGQMKSGRFQKTKKLVELGGIAINFSCGLSGYH